MQSIDKIDPKRRAKLIQDILIAERDLFACDVNQYISKYIAQPYDFKQDRRKTGWYASSNWPSGAMKDLISPTLELKHGVGGISIEEVYRKDSFKDSEAELVRFTYRFIDQIHIVQYTHTHNGTVTRGEEGFYHFRYDMDLRPQSQDPKYHLQVTNNAPSFIVSEGIDLRLFLSTVKNTWFKPDYTLKGAPYWDNKR